MFKHLSKPFFRAFQGAVLATGAPLGWLLIRYLQNIDIWTELVEYTGVYLYMLVGTTIAFACFGWYVGHNESLSDELAIRDHLTGLYNVRYFQNRLVEETNSSKRHQIPLSLIIYDIDHFKQVNDHYGHPAGDKVLIAISETAQKNLRSSEVVARVGGEEFAVLLPFCTEEHAIQTAERIREAVSKIKVTIDNQNQISRTISLGVASLQQGENCDSLYRRADTALYEAKNSGRNKAIVSSDSKTSN
ncbi:GGDEF domain-containing protein [Endozoicomonas sp. SM1973]|uniref:diguanylate cyclase n=1 Tax=Spartinivicinus marinus TaxID=2994442 RepID=A0A853ILC4_9GAMM|nr:GGDEF domain-containing protein [Spartinivicinus marinus]MCX4027732.1 GGDEF domain-containing protein [Spartinivicinus marinus]NYZ68536.1 GGDEF domain-containing protein [Spartinivicinus marinus]